ncbi:cytochrome c oxidase accessory protein CcoG [Crocinitomix catalasitica]|uniref:cytochrome c oxidase accessory protein CcoG n=1 Tax=Crocinitomix catalasitica TaxID=184607 RepID=UPI0004844BF7|nr:cytochrome c oxidase accessory protein CcoG [Crocinitomix catalasitica]
MGASNQSESFRDKISTVGTDGKRVWVYPKKQLGKYFNKRALVSYVLLLLLFSGPFIKINGEPLLLMNILERKFVIFGQIFWPQDIFIFAIGMIAFVILVIVFTVVFGRLFCGWVCPQTIFMEMVFRRIEYWIDGDWKQQKKLDNMPWNGHKIFKRVLKWSVFWAISFLIANTLLAYLIGIEELQDIVFGRPSEHISGLIAIVLFTSVFFAVFTWFREQVCTTVCPYGRLQGVLLDKNSIVVAYDYVRGEIRAKFRKNEDRVKEEKGDCIDCNQCVNVCPTGIDIRNGTQLECVSCTLCMDACDHMMDAVGLEKGLIRYDSEEGIKTGKPWKLTTRTKAYIVLMFAIVGLLATLILTRSEIDMNILRVRGTTYQKLTDSTYVNIFETTILNKTNQDHNITLKILSENASVESIGGDLVLKKGEVLQRELIVTMDEKAVLGPSTPVIIGLYEDGVLMVEQKINFNGPGF